MIRSSLALLFFVGALWTVPARGQVVVFDNLGSSGGFGLTQAGADTDFVSQFTTGAASPLVLTALDFRVRTTGTGPTGTGELTYVTSVYTDNGGVRGTLLETSTPFVRSVVQTFVSEVAHFDFAPLLLTASTPYWVDITWSITSGSAMGEAPVSFSQTSSYGWSAANSVFAFPSGSQMSGIPLAFAITATVPEPSTYALLGLAGIVGAWRCRARRRAIVQTST